MFYVMIIHGAIKLKNTPTFETPVDFIEPAIIPTQTDGEFKITKKCIPGIKHTAHYLKNKCPCEIHLSLVLKTQ